jgi:hypothetical protein
MTHPPPTADKTLGGGPQQPYAASLKPPTRHRRPGRPERLTGNPGQTRQKAPPPLLADLDCAVHGSVHDFASFRGPLPQPFQPTTTARTTGQRPAGKEPSSHPIQAARSTRVLPGLGRPAAARVRRGREAGYAPPRCRPDHRPWPGQPTSGDAVLGMRIGPDLHTGLPGRGQQAPSSSWRVSVYGKAVHGALAVVRPLVGRRADQGPAARTMARFRTLRKDTATVAEARRSPRCPGASGSTERNALARGPGIAARLSMRSTRRSWRGGRHYEQTSTGNGVTRRTRTDIARSQGG